MKSSLGNLSEKTSFKDCRLSALKLNLKVNEMSLKSKLTEHSEYSFFFDMIKRNKRDIDSLKTYSDREY